MPFYQASTSSSTPSADAFSFIDAGLSAHAGWALVDSGTGLIGGRLTHIWKCLGSQNAYGQDFYVTLTRDTAGASTVTLKLSEGYNVTTKNLIRPAPVPTVSTTLSSTDGSIGGGTEFTQASGVAMELISGYSTGVGTDHFMTVSKSFFAYGYNLAGAAGQGFYVGNFDPAYSSTYNPVMLLGATGSFLANSNATRFPNYTSTPTGGGDVYVLPATFPDGYLTTLSIPDKFRGLTEATSVIITGIASVSTFAGGPGLFASGGGLRGSLPSSVMLMAAEGSAPRNGDFFTVGSNDYFRIGNNVAAGSYAQMVFAPNKSFYVSKTATY